MAFGRTNGTVITYLLTSAVSSHALVAYERLHGSALCHFCNAVIWIVELAHVKKSWKLVEINFTTLF